MELISSGNIKSTPKDLLHLCPFATSFKKLPQEFSNNYFETKLSNNLITQPDIFCQLNDLKLLDHKKYHAIWMPYGFNTLLKRELLIFLNETYKLLRANSSFSFLVPNIKEVSRISYQYGWSKVIPHLGLSAKELSYGIEDEIKKFGQQATVKQAFNAKGLENLFKQTKFLKLEVMDQGLYFAVKATKITSPSTFNFKYSELDVNLRVATRDKLDQATNLKVQY